MNIKPEHKTRLLNALLALILVIFSVTGSMVTDYFTAIGDLPPQSAIVALGTTNFTAISAEDLTATDDLAVTDDSTLTDDVAIGGDLTVTGYVTTTTNATVGGDLAVTDDSTLTDDVAIGGDLTVTGYVTTTTNTTVGGNLAVTGDATITGALTAEALLLLSFTNLTVTSPGLSTGQLVTPTYTVYALDSSAAVSLTLQAVGTEGQLLILIGDDANNITINDTNLRSNDGAAQVLNAYDVLILVYQDAEWVEISESSNS